MAQVLVVLGRGKGEEEKRRTGGHCQQQKVAEDQVPLVPDLAHLW